MSGMTIVNIAVGHDGYVDGKDVQAKAEKYKDELGTFYFAVCETL